MFSSKLLHFVPTPRFLKFSFIGVEITKDSVYYSELDNKGRGIQLLRFGKKEYKQTTDVFSNADLKRVLKELKKETGCTHIKYALPEESTYLFTIDIEGKTSTEQRANIEFQLEENVPISGADALFEFYVVDNVENSKKRVIVSVVSRQIIEKYTNLFLECGMTPVSFVAESNSLSRAILKRGDKSTCLVVNLSQERTVCSVINRGFVQFSSIVNAGSDLITDTLRKHYNLSTEDAEKVKDDKGIIKDEKNETTFSVLANAVSVLRDEIERVAIYWRTHLDKESKWPISKIILTGKDATIPGFSDYLSTSLKIEVEIANVWVNVSRYKTEIPPISFKESLSYGPCLGLSLGDLK